MLTLHISFIAWRVSYVAVQCGFKSWLMAENVLIRQATTADIDTVMLLLDLGRQRMEASGNRHQWTVGYPRRDLRIDTHQDNAPMLYNIRKHGFEYCGVIHVGDGSERLAFQWMDKDKP